MTAHAPSPGPVSSGEVLRDAAGFGRDGRKRACRTLRMGPGRLGALPVRGSLGHQPSAAPLPPCP